MEDREVHKMALFPIMQYDTSSTKKQRLALIDEHFTKDGQYRMPYVVDVIIAEAP